MYRELAPGNIEYDQKLKLHKRGKAFEPELVPHPRIEHSEAIELDYGMKDGVMKVEIRAATEGYLFRLRDVDCSKEAQLKTPEFHLWLKNYQTLYGVGNLASSPDFDMVTE
tara:strand:- start:3730 stop:4062 length:333 start_codon:yes stop_codon:yes gene_type:complete